MSWLLAVVFKPLAFYLIVIWPGLALRRLIDRKMPEGRLKHELLKHRWGPRDSIH